MRRGLVMIASALILGAVATSNHISPLADLATFLLLAGIAYLGVTLWQRRRSSQR